MSNLRCPRCGLSHIKKNGRTHYSKQNHICLVCGRHFVADAHRIDGTMRTLIRKLLLERLSLRGICRVLEMSLTWLLPFIDELYDHPEQHYFLSTTQLFNLVSPPCFLLHKLFARL